MQIEYKVTGMSCVICAAHVKEAAENVEGVEKAEVNFAAGSMVVSGTADPREVAKAVKKAGYKAIPSTDKETGSVDETVILLIRFLVSAVFAVQVLLIAYGVIDFGDPLINILVSMFLTFPCIVCGYRFYVNGFRGFVTLHPGMDSLISLGTIASFFGGIRELIRIIGGESTSGFCFESVSMILTLVLLGKYLEGRARRSTGDAIKTLSSLMPQSVTVREENGEEVLLPLSALKPGMTVIVRSGERIPADGTVAEGRAEVDESMLTGESLPVHKESGSKVTGASLNTDGVLTVRVSAVGEDTVLSAIIRRVKSACGSKAPIEKLADRVAGVFVPAVILIALLSGGIWYFLDAGTDKVISVVTSVLVVACPCAMGLATPVAVICSVGRGARSGILIKDGTAIEKTAKIDTVVFDKTGTLTEGHPEVVRILAGENGDEECILKIAASAEQFSTHPSAKAIVAAYQKLGIPMIDVKDYSSIAGKGITAVCKQGRIVVGNRRFLTENGIRVPEEKETGSGSRVYVALEEKVLGTIELEDQIRTDSAKTVEKLRQMGVKTVLLSGDNPLSAERVGKAVGIDERYSGVLPEEKAEHIRKWISQGSKPAMVGDGINDAAAMAESILGIALSDGTDVAVDASDIVLLSDKLMGVAASLELARKSMKIIRQNLIWAFVYNALCLTLASGFLTLFGGPGLTPAVSAALMSVSSLTVTLNSLRLKRTKLSCDT